MRDYACAILVEDGRLLLGKRAPHRKAYANKWDVIGGLVESGESFEEALMRELREETGVTPIEWERLCSVLDAGPEARGEATYHMFTVRAWTGGQPAMTNHEHTALTWFTVAEACALPDLAMDDYRAVFGQLSF